MKIFFKIALPIILVLYFPMFGKIIPEIVRSVPYNFVHWSTLFLLAITMMQVLFRWRFARPNSDMSHFLYFSFFYSGVLLIKGLATGSLQEALNLTAGVNISILLVLFVSQQREFGRDERLFRIITGSIAVMLVLQTALSAIESARGVLFGEYLVNVYGSLEGRDVLQLFNLSQSNIFGFSIPFTGLIGQHNPFGIMLLFYSVYFLMQYEHGKERYMVFLVPLILFGFIGNGTRSAFALAILTFGAFFYETKLTKVKPVFRWILLAVIGVLIVVGVGEEIVQAISTFYLQSDTLTYRANLWQTVLDTYLNIDSIPRFLFGLRVEDIKLATVDVVGRIVSVESEYIRIFLSAGMIGIVLYVRTFVVLFKTRYQKRFPNNKVSLKLLSTNVLLISLVMTGVSFYASYFLIALSLLSATHIRLIREIKNSDSSQGLPSDNLK